jgi:O-antigen ligase
MKIVNKVLLICGLQNLWQLGSLYPLNLLATIYYISKARFKLHTSLDVLIAGYCIAGVISLVTGITFSLMDGADLNLLLNSFKSFFVFLTVLVFFGAYRLQLEEFFDLAMLVFAVTVMAILGTYLYIFLTEPLSLYLTRSAITWCSGWPQRWVMFCLVGHFLFLCQYDWARKKIYLLLSFMFLTAVLLSATRSAVLGLIVGYIVLSILTYRDFLRAVTVILVISFITSFFVDQIQDAFRIQELTEYSSSDGADGSSMNNRIHNLWPGIINSLGVSRIPFGWGHVGLAHIPHEFFVDTSQLSSIAGEESGSAESQYMDVLLRQGVIGFLIFLAIHLCGFIYSYKLYKFDTDSKRQALWKASLAWQAAIFVHGITVETTRLPLYSLFFFLFLGILSNSYYRLIIQRNANSSAFSGNLALSSQRDA